MDEINFASSDYREAGTKLLGIIQKFCPTDTEQELCLACYNQAQRDALVAGDDVYKAGFKYLLNMLSDGVNYGNWPWVFLKNWASLND